MIKHLLLFAFILITCFAGMLPTGSVNRNYTLDDSWPTTWEDSSMDIYTTYSMYSQSFTSGGGITDNVLVRLQKIGSPTGTATVRIYASSGSLPTGAVVAETDTLDVSTVGASLASYTFRFSGANRVPLTATGGYCVVVRYAGGDSSNKLKVGTDTTAANQHGGRLGYYDSSWHLDNANNDMIFYSYVYR
jgi:hypothetical protein